MSVGTVAKWAIGGIAAFAAASIIYKYVRNKNLKPISKSKASKALDQIIDNWKAALQKLQEMDKVLRQSIKDESRLMAQMQQVAGEVMQQLSTNDKRVLVELGISQSQFRDAIKRYASDKAFARKVEEMGQIQSALMHGPDSDDVDPDPSELPEGMTAEKATTTVRDVLETSIVVMEQVVGTLAEKYEYKAGTPMPPEMVQEINATYSRQYPLARAGIFAKYGVSEATMGLLARAYRNNPEFARMIQEMSKQKIERFGALGLAIASQG